MRKATPQIAAIHDLSGYGRASLTVVIPILSSMGIQVCPLPTAVLSAHSEYEGFHCIDLTNHMPSMIEHWKKLNLQFDAIYSGYLGSHSQIEIVTNFIKDFKKDKQLIIVDPVMGDNGMLYPGIENTLVKEMKKLAYHADIITPNITEAGLLLEKDLNNKSSLEEIKLAAKELSENGPNTVIITSVPDTDPKKTAVLAYTKTNNEFIYISNEYIPASYPGTGDAFTSVLTGALINGDTLNNAMKKASTFILKGIQATINMDHDPLNGINQEEILPLLSNSLN
jgi:pyridoxine kinase